MCRQQSYAPFQKLNKKFSFGVAACDTKKIKVFSWSKDNKINRNRWLCTCTMIKCYYNIEEKWGGKKRKH